MTERSVSWYLLCMNMMKTMVAVVVVVVVVVIFVRRLLPLLRLLRSIREYKGSQWRWKQIILSKLLDRTEHVYQNKILFHPIKTNSFTLQEKLCSVSPWPKTTRFHFHHKFRRSYSTRRNYLFTYLFIIPYFFKIKSQNVRISHLPTELSEKNC